MLKYMARDQRATCQTYHRNAFQRRQQGMKGRISDEGLLAAFSRHSACLWDYVVSKLSFTEMRRKHKEFLDQRQSGTAGELMSVNHITFSEEAPIEEAIRFVTEHNLKRLPALDSQGYYKGMVSRESLLRTGFTRWTI